MPIKRAHLALIEGELANQAIVLRNLQIEPINAVSHCSSLERCSLREYLPLSRKGPPGGVPFSALQTVAAEIRRVGIGFVATPLAHEMILVRYHRFESHSFDTVGTPRFSHRDFPGHSGNHKSALSFLSTIGIFGKRKGQIRANYKQNAESQLPYALQWRTLAHRSALLPLSTPFALAFSTG